ncbi:MAG: hypothetical protein H7X94_00180 [Vallitaleaceae bacterium]|nr:hypothetical protein [Vallitaleaceae bacterium]
MKKLISLFMVFTLVVSIFTNMAVKGQTYSDLLIGIFETGTDNWQLGGNVTGLSCVTSTLNAPGVAFEGSSLGEITSSGIAGTTWRSIYKNFTTPLDLTSTPYFSGAFNTYGINASNTNFEVKLTFYSNAQTYSTTKSITGDKWNEIAIDLSGWAYKNNVTKMEVAFRSTTYAAAWGAKHQLDGMKFSELPQGAFETGTDNWQWGANVTALLSVATSLNQPGTAFKGNNMGEISSSGVAGTTWRSVYKNFATPLNLTTTPYFSGAFNTYGINASNTSFEVKLTFYSNSQTYTVTKNISGNLWNKVSVDLSGWAYKNNVTKMEVAFRSTTYTPLWEAKHQMDDLKFSETNPFIIYNGVVNVISAGAQNINISGSYNTTSTVQLSLIELKPYDTYNPLVTYTPLNTQSFTSSNGVANFSFVAPRMNGNVDRVYSKFAVINNATKELVDSVKYVTDIQNPANNYAFPQATTIKGLQVQTIDDAQKLGIGHAALNVAFDQMFVSSGSTNEKIAYTMDGETYYFRKAFFDNLDRDTKTLSDNNVTVTYILIMYDLVHCGGGSNAERWNESAGINNILLHPNYSGYGTVAAFNTTNEVGTKYFKAAMEFLGSRYTRSDELYGRAVNYIVGNEVNSQYYWYDMGDKNINQFTDDYARTLRIANTAIKKYYSNARVYISMDHFWNGAISSDNLKVYKGKDVMDGLNAKIKLEGDISWNVAYHPYPEDLFDPTVWQDTTATTSFDTVRINFKNLNVLSDYMKQTDYLYNGQMRRIILSEQGFHSLSNSSADQQIQAAAYAYSYYKAKFTDGVDSFILHRHVDHGLEGGLNLGLWTRDTTKPVPYAPGNQKYIYNIFQNIDTNSSLSVTNFAKSIIGITNWADVIPGFDSTKLAERVPPVIGNLVSQAIAPTTNVSSFETGTDGWVISEYAKSMASVTSYANSPGTPYSGSKVLEVNFGESIIENAYLVGGARAESGVTKEFSVPINVTSTPKFEFAINSYGGCPSATVYNVTVRIYSGNNIIEGKALVNPDTWNTYSMDLSSWGYKGAIDKIKIWYSTNSTYNWMAKYQLDSIGF